MPGLCEAKSRFPPVRQLPVEIAPRAAIPQQRHRSGGRMEAGQQLAADDGQPYGQLHHPGCWAEQQPAVGADQGGERVPATGLGVRPGGL